MNYLLDTNVWFRLFDSPHEINEAVRRTLQSEKRLAVSSFSLIEVAQKQSKHNFLAVPVRDWFKIAIPRGRIEVLTVTPEIAVRSYNLGDHFHGDPADRIITATALVHNLTLVTSDRKLLAETQIQTLSTRQP
ncbi:MAG: type II toxin-antitoxin system VapC family toxin [Verrucomicrobia bacterium]|nr:type II toxin-antitoxin system VapC family toxin [Verrucomicrobiota bacterium]MCH8511751.1 type II toxin-antitoxin system VapC family toxin [Kiritimatiellia bacterium]